MAYEQLMLMVLQANLGLKREEIIAYVRTVLPICVQLTREGGWRGVSEIPVLEVPGGGVMMSGLSARRLVVPALTALPVIAAAAILWSLLYAAITAIAFKDMGLLRTVTEHDPTASLTHLRYYWSDDRVPRHALIAAAATVVILGGLAVSAWLIRPPSTFGDARFASSGEITRANLHAKTGLILGRRGGLLLRHDAPGHVLVEGPTRSGKGQGFVEPNLLTWEGSLICLDPKQENFKATAAARIARGDACFLFAPGSTRSHAYNPLDLVRRGPQMATDLANLAAFLIPEPRGEGAFWASSARNLFAASLGYVLETPLAAEARHIGAVLALFSTGKDIAEALQVIVKTEAAHLSPFIVDQFNQFVPMPEKTRGSVVAHLIDALKPWNNPLVVAATARSDFNLRELRETPMAIFIGAPVADLESYRPLIRVLVQQAHDQLMRDLPRPPTLRPSYHAGRVPDAAADGSHRRQAAGQRGLRCAHGDRRAGALAARRALRAAPHATRSSLTRT